MNDTVKQAPRIQDLSKFSMFAEIPGGTNGQKQRARLQWSMRGGNPRISVFAFNANTNKNEVLSAPLPPDLFLLFCDQLISLINNGQSNIKAKIECHLGLRDAGGKLTGEKRLLSELWYGIDENNQVWISVVEGEKPRVKFVFNLWEYNKIFKSDGSELTASESSKLLALSTMVAIKQIYTNNMAVFAEYQAAGQAAKTGAAPKAAGFNVEDIDF